MIHKFSFGDFYFVLDVESGSLLKVDKPVYDILDLYPVAAASAQKLEPGGPAASALARARFNGMYGEALVNECRGEIDALIEGGLLFSRAVSESAFARNAKNPVVKALCLHLAHSCNLRCAYCFAQDGAQGGKNALMPLETARNCVLFLINNSGGRKHLEIDFFGGEPLLNFEVLKQTVFFAKKQSARAGKVFRFTLTTNATLLDDKKIAFINEHIDNVVISLDGRRETNDAMRVFKGGGGTYDAVLPKIKLLLEKRRYQNYFIRGTVTNRNLDFIDDVLRLYDLGFTQISLEPVVLKNGDPLAINADGAETLCGAYGRLAEKMLSLKKAGDGFDFFHFNVDLKGGPCVYKRLSGCGAGSEYFAVSPDGFVYPCHRLTGFSEFYSGDINSVKSAREFKQTPAFAPLARADACAGCFAKYFCGFGCPANAYVINGDLSKPYETGCRLLKKRLECALFYNYRLTCL